MVIISQTDRVILLCASHQMRSVFLFSSFKANCTLNTDVYFILSQFNFCIHTQICLKVLLFLSTRKVRKLHQTPKYTEWKMCYLTPRPVKVLLSSYKLHCLHLSHINGQFRFAHLAVFKGQNERNLNLRVARLAF